MTVAPAAEGQSRRIGDILLELGFASEEALAKASVEQEKTGQPLGQILVDQGVITRLELASALAEQWSDQSQSITLLPVPPPAPRPTPPKPQDEDQYAARLQDAVAELALRVGANHASAGIDERVTDLAQRVEATVARAQRIEASLATLAEQLEGVTGGAEGAFTALQTGLAGLAIDLARIDTTVAEIVARPEEGPSADPALEARLDELAAAVQSLVERPAVDESLGARVEQLSAEIGTFAERPVVDESLGFRVEQLSAELGALAERPVADESLGSRIEQLAEEIRALAERPVTDESLGSRVEQLAAEIGALAERPVVDESLGSRTEQLAEEIRVLAERPAVDESLGSRVDALEGHAASLAEIRAVLAELESRPVGNPDLDARMARIEAELGGQLAEAPRAADIEKVTARLEKHVDKQKGLAAAVDELSSRLDTVAQPDDRIGHAAARIAELEAQLADVLNGLDDVRHAVGAQGTETPERLDELGAGLAAMRDEVSALAHAATPPERVEEIAALVDGLAAERAVLDSLAAKLEDVERQIPAEVVTPTALAEALAQAREEIVADTRVEPDPRIDQIAAELEMFRATAAELGAPDPAITERLDDLSARLEQVAAHGDAQGALAAKLDDVEGRLPSDVISSAELAEALAQSREQIVAETHVEPDPRIDELAGRIEQLASHAETQASLAAKIDDVERRLPSDVISSAELAEALAQSREQIVAETHVEPDPRIDELAGRIEQLASHAETQASLAAKIDDVERRLPSDIVTLDDLAQALGKVRDELGSVGPVPPDPRIERLQGEVAALRDDPGPIDRIDALRDELAGIRAELAEAVAGAAAPDPEAEQRLAALEESVEQIATVGDVQAGIAAKLEEIESRIPTRVVTPDELTDAIDRARADLAQREPAPPDPRIDDLVGELEALRGRVEAAPAPASPELDPATRDEIEAIGAKLAAMETRLPDEPVTSADITRAVDELRAELDTLAPVVADTSHLERSLAVLGERFVGLETLSARVDELAESADTGAQAGVPDERFDKLEARVQQLAEMLEERLAAAASGGGTSSSLDADGLQDELERNRMTLERLGLHLGEHDRALAELMKSRNLPKRLDELAVRVEELAAGAPLSSAGAEPSADGDAEGKGRGFDRTARALPGELAHEMKALLRRVEDAEIANSEDREKLMVRLERMASSIDWRLQRLEAPPASE